MTPANPPPPEVQEPANSAAVDSTSQREQSRPDQSAARTGSLPAEKPRPEEKSALLAWAYVEYQRLRQQGRPPDLHQWCAGFPICRSSLRQVLEVEAFAASFLDRHCPSSGDESIDWPIEGGQREDFTILRELARGAFARVYLATEASTGGRLVVLKCSLQGDAEARTLGRLAYPHIVPILSARREERSGLTLVCMPYLGSATLEDVLDHLAAAETRPSKASFLLDVIRFRAQPEDPPRPVVEPHLLHGNYTDGVIHLAAQLAETLAFLHQSGVCHRDLKPSNVLLDPSGKPLLLDFNLSESEREAAVPVGGTLRYMAPEQLRAFVDRRKDGMDERADFYALGVMVYELLGGTHPCDALLAESVRPSQAQSMLTNLNTGFRPFREICPELERPVAAVLERCVALDASDRPGNAAELAAVLKQQFTPARRLRRWLADHRRWLAATLGLLLVAVAVLAYVWAVTPPYSQREYDRGRIAYHAGDFAAAETHFDRALHAEPNNARFRQARGCARLQQSKYLPPDQEMFDRILDDLTFTERGAADVRTLAVHAYTQLRSQKYDAAIKKYNLIQRSGYRPLMVLNNRAFGFLSTGRLKEAQSDLDKAVRLDSHCQAVRYNRAWMAIQMRLLGKIKAISPQALEDMEQALQLGPQTSALYRDAAILYAQAAGDDPRHSQWERALAYLGQAITEGEPPEHFSLSQSLVTVLKRPEFVTQLGSQPLQAAPQPDLRLIDPVDLPDY
jgi:serine/threonine protein kinase/Flp pilus assembly protein TadD